MKCPRCDADTVRVMTRISGWRCLGKFMSAIPAVIPGVSTEEIHVHDVFKLKPEDIPNLQQIPPVPPLKK